MKMFRYLLSKSASKMVRVFGLALVCAALASPAFAQSWGGGGGGSCGPTPPNCGGGGGGAPEIDPNSLAGALTILSGGVLVLSDRFRRK